MSLKDRFRFDELVKKGSKAIPRDDSKGIVVRKIDGKEVKPEIKKINRPFGVEPIRGKQKEPKLKTDLLEPQEEQNIEQSSFSGETASSLERPYYDKDELEKAIDVKVDELIKPKKEPKERYIKYEKYQNKLAEIEQLILDKKDLTDDVNALTSTISTLETEIQDLQNQVIAAEERTRSVESEFESLSNRYKELLSDFQNAVLKGTKEGIERVSMTAQVRGLGAQKETLASQLESEKETVKALQSANETLQQTIQTNSQIAQQQIEAANQQVKAAQATASTAANSKKKKIICVELYNQGYLPYEIYKADEDWGDMMFVKDPRLVVGYMMWSRPIVEWMKKNPNHILIDIFYHSLSKYWCAWMADQMGVKVNKKRIWIGKLIHNIFGHGLSKFVYDNFGGERRYRVLKYLEAKNGN